MHRRSFIGSIGALGLAGATTDKRTQVYAIQHFKLRNGAQVPRLHEFLSQAVLPAINRVHSGPKIYLEAMVAPHVPQVTAIYGFASLDEVWGVHAKIMQDEAMGKGVVALESGPDPGFESIDSALIQAADFSP